MLRKEIALASMCSGVSGDPCAYWPETASAIQHQFNAVRIVRQAALIEVAGLQRKHDARA